MTYIHISMLNLSFIIRVGYTNLMEFGRRVSSIRDDYPRVYRSQSVVESTVFKGNLESNLDSSMSDELR